MSTLKTSAIRHPSSSTDNITLNSDGSFTPSGRSILEVITSPCIGNTISSSNGDITLGNVTGVQNLTTTYTEITGSRINNYTPPSSAKQVVYEYYLQASRAGDSHQIAHFKFFLTNNSGTYEVEKARMVAGSEDLHQKFSFKWVINIGGATDYTIGRLNSWDLTSMHMTARDYSNSHDVKLHVTDYWDGVGTDMLSVPILTVTAIG